MKMCSKCVLPETYPGIAFDTDGVCNYCRQYAYGEKYNVNRDFAGENELIDSLVKYKNPASKYDVLVPLSGGVDSSAALITITEKYKMKALGFHYDHGYEDEVATNNVRKLCKALDVDLVIKQQDLSFMKKLWRYVHESSTPLSACYICGGILYANALDLADQLQIPLVINGYSKGQASMLLNKENALELWEDLLEKFMEDEEFFNGFMAKQNPLHKQIVFQNRRDIDEGVKPGKILVIPFYVFNFYKTDKEALKEACMKRFEWQPMKTTYPNRTTNCQMIWLNTYMDLKKMNYSMYTEEYSSLIRTGDMTREQALEDLDFSPPDCVVERLAREVGIIL